MVFASWEMAGESKTQDKSHPSQNMQTLKWACVTCDRKQSNLGKIKIMLTGAVDRKPEDYMPAKADSSSG